MANRQTQSPNKMPKREKLSQRDRCATACCIYHKTIFCRKKSRLVTEVIAQIAAQILPQIRVGCGIALCREHAFALSKWNRRRARRIPSDDSMRCPTRVANISRASRALSVVRARDDQ
jgi:hypothetical protein